MWVPNKPYYERYVFPIYLGVFRRFRQKPYHFRIPGQDFEKFGKAIWKFRKSRVLPIMIPWVVGWGGFSKTQKDATRVGHKINNNREALQSLVWFHCFCSWVNQCILKENQKFLKKIRIVAFHGSRHGPIQGTSDSWEHLLSQTINLKSKNSALFIVYTRDILMSRY